MTQYDVVIKQVEPLKVAAVRGVVPTPPDQGRLWQELESYLASQHIQPVGSCFSLYYDDEYKEKDWDIEVCEPIAGDLPETQRVKVRDLTGGAAMACVAHHGPFVTIGQAYEALMKWIGENGYHIVGPGREVYLREAREGDQDDPNTLTEIQFPVDKG